MKKKLADNLAALEQKPDFEVYMVASCTGIWSALENYFNVLTSLIQKFYFQGSLNALSYKKSERAGLIQQMSRCRGDNMLNFLMKHILKSFRAILPTNGAGKAFLFSTQQHICCLKTALAFIETAKRAYKDVRPSRRDAIVLAGGLGRTFTLPWADNNPVYETTHLVSDVFEEPSEEALQVSANEHIKRIFALLTIACGVKVQVTARLYVSSTTSGNTATILSSLKDFVLDGLSLEVYDLTGKTEERTALFRETGCRTLPQCFIDDKFIGGFTEIRSALNSNTFSSFTGSIAETNVDKGIVKAVDETGVALRILKENFAVFSGGSSLISWTSFLKGWHELPNITTVALLSGNTVEDWQLPVQNKSQESLLVSAQSSIRFEYEEIKAMESKANILTLFLENSANISSQILQLYANLLASVTNSTYLPVPVDLSNQPLAYTWLYKDELLSNIRLRITKLVNGRISEDDFPAIVMAMTTEETGAYLQGQALMEENNGVFNPEKKKAFFEKEILTWLGTHVLFSKSSPMLLLRILCKHGVLSRSVGNGQRFSIVSKLYALVYPPVLLTSLLVKHEMKRTPELQRTAAGVVLPVLKAGPAILSNTEPILDFLENQNGVQLSTKEAMAIANSPLLTFIGSRDGFAANKESFTGELQKINSYLSNLPANQTFLSGKVMSRADCVLASKLYHAKVVCRVPGYDQENLKVRSELDMTTTDNQWFPTIAEMPRLHSYMQTVCSTQRFESTCPSHELIIKQYIAAKNEQYLGFSESADLNGYGFGN